MRAPRTSIPLAALFAATMLGPPTARAAGEIAVYGIRHEPIGRIDDFVDGSWGGGVEAHFDQPSWHPGASLGLGGEFVSLHSQGNRSEDYFRIFSGPRWLLMNERTLRPYLDAHLSLVRHAVTTTTYAFRDWGFGYDVGGGLHLNPFDRITGFVGVRYLQSFGVQGDPPNDDIKFNPQYWNAYGGIAWTFGYLELD